MRKSKQLIAGLIGAAAIAMSTASHGAGCEVNPEDWKSWMCLSKADPMMVMKMMDKGNKGYVTKDEYMKFHDQMFTKMDTNKDGRISTSEWIATP